MDAKIKHSEPSLGLTSAVFAALLVLLVVTVLVAQVELGSWNFVVAAGVATLKAVLILLVFMRVYYGTPLIWLVSGAGFVWLAILFNFVFCDYMTRGDAHSPTRDLGVSYEVRSRSTSD
ncbi:MAG: cytochrome C oxidase subunit IV family protein [Planctomycetota bacterium]